MADIDPKLSMLLPVPESLAKQSVASQSFTKGMELIQSNNPGDAYPLFVATVAEDPTHAGAWYQISIMLFADKRYAAARAAMERVNALHPNNPRVLTNLGWYAHAAEDTDAGFKYITRAVELGPDLALGWSNLSQIQIANKDLNAALISARKGVELCSDGNPIHSMCLAFAHLFRGELQQGLEFYRARLRYKLQQFLSYAYPFWKGERVGTLFLRAEQGIGDTITTLRLLPEAASRADHVLCYVNAELRTLVEDMSIENMTVVALPAILPAKADAWLPMMDLPMVLGLETKDIVERFAPPYINVGAGRASIGGPKHVGIVWAGGGDMDMDRWRSVPLADFIPLTYLPGVKIYTLQVGAPKAQIVTEGLHGLVEDLGPNLTDFRETARIVSSLDVVISVCTSTAHLAAAMGKTTYVLRNRRSSDWRWGLGERDPKINPAPWYPNARVFERDYDEQWSDVIQRVKEALVNG